MKDYYKDLEGYLLQIKVIEDGLDELDKYSVWNDDNGSSELDIISRQLNSLKEKVVKEMNRY